MPEVNDIFQLITTASNILILFKGVLTNEDVDYISTLQSILNKEGKRYQVYAIEKQDSKLEEYAKSKNVELTNNLKASEYIVSIDYGSTGVEKVVYDTDKENGKLIFKILPSKAGFSFDKVEFKEGGDKFDGTITIGLENPQDLKAFYDENEYLFRENSLFKIQNSKDIISLLLTNPNNIDETTASMLLDNVVSSTNLLEGSLEKESVDQIVSLLDLGADLSLSLRKKYYSKNDDYLDLIKEILANVKNDNKIIYSYLMSNSVKKYGLTNILNIGRLPFNYLEKYEIAILFVQDEQGIMHAVIESNDPQKFSAMTIAGVFGGVGDAGHAVSQLDGMSIEEVNKRFSPILKDLYNIDFSIKIEPNTVDNLPKVLTKGRRNSKNKGLNNIG